MFMSRLNEQAVSDLDRCIVQTAQGKLRGICKDGTFIFRGIKYADAERFEEPVPVQPWEGVIDAMWYEAICPNITTPLPHDQILAPHAFGPQDENCQYLNIWTQALDNRAKRPVIVFIHGGAGSSVEQYCYDGEEMSKFGDVVMVTFNHRMNILGCLDFSEFGEKYVNSKSLSLADITAALKWVRENIASFGGDPDNVTLEGQSFGNFKAIAVMQSPAADGLYHRVICSGDPSIYPKTVNGYEPAEVSRMTAKKMVEAAGGMEALKALSYEELADVYLKADSEVRAVTGGVGAPMSLIPSGKEGAYYIGHPLDVGFRRENLHIPMLVGTSFGEHYSNIEYDAEQGKRTNRFSMKSALSNEKVATCIRRIFGDDAKEAEDLFAELFPYRAGVDLLFMDRLSRYNWVELAKKRIIQGSAPVYSWVFDTDSLFLGGITAWHCSEIHYHFHNAQFNEASYIPGITEKLQDEMAGAWCRFAEFGDPNPAAAAGQEAGTWTEWKPVTEKTCITMWFSGCAGRIYLTEGQDERLLELLRKHI